MKPYYEQDGQTIYHGDCREVLPSIADSSVDLICTDPPYGVSYVTAWRSRSDKLRVGIANDETLDVVAEAWPAIMAKLANDRHWYAFASPRKITDAEKAFGVSKHLLAWDKGDRGTVGDLECGFGEAWEAIFYGMKGRRPLNGKRPRTVIRYDWSGTMDPLHPTVKPVDLLQRLINWSTSVGEVVLDPFMGSGTTLRAAKDLGRRAIGIEIEERYCEIAANRLAQGVLFFGRGCSMIRWLTTEKLEHVSERKPTETVGSGREPMPVDGVKNAGDGANGTGTECGSIINIGSSTADLDSHIDNSSQDLGAEQHDKRDGLERVLERKSPAPAGPRKGGGA